MKVRLPNDFYDKLAARLYVSTDFAKRAALLCGYGGGDPWLRHLVLGEMEKIL